jgi:hypothetical protein
VKYEPCLFTGFLKTEPDGTLEAIAAQYNTTLLEVVKNLPPRRWFPAINLIPSGKPSANGAKSPPWSILLMSYWNSRVNYLPDSTATVTSTCAAKKA